MRTLFHSMFPLVISELSKVTGNKITGITSMLTGDFIIHTVVALITGVSITRRNWVNTFIVRQDHLFQDRQRFFQILKVVPCWWIWSCCMLYGSISTCRKNWLVEISSERKLWDANFSLCFIVWSAAEQSAKGQVWCSNSFLTIIWRSCGRADAVVPNTHQEVVWLDVTMNEILVVDISVNKNNQKGILT